MYVWTIAFRYIRRRPITWLTIASIMLLVAAFVVVMSVLRGFYDYLRENVRKTSAHVEIDRPSVEGLRDYVQLGDRIVATDDPGAPGLFGFSPQSKKRVYIDNIRITAKD